MITFRILKNELLRLARDRVLMVLSVLVLILLTVSVLTGHQFVKQLSVAQTEAEHIARLQWEQQGAKNPHSAAHYGTFAFKPVSLLMVFEPGITRYTGVSLFLEGHRQNAASFSLAEDQEASLRFAELKPAFIFTYLFPLLIIFAGFRMISSEKESGMYRFLIAQGVTRKQMLAGKALALWLLVLALFLPFFVLGLLVAGLVAAPSIELLRYILISVVWLVYFGIIVNLTIGTSALVKHSNMAMVGLLAFWITIALVVPKVTSNIAANRYPVPSTTEFYQAVRDDLLEGVDGHNPFSEHSVAFRDSVLAAYGVEIVDDLPFNFRGMMLQEAEEFEKRIYDLHLSRIEEIHARQMGAFSVGTLFSPALAMRLSAMHFAGTDRHAFNRFTAQAESYRIDLMRVLNNDLRDNTVGDQAVGYVAHERFFSENPMFVYQRAQKIQIPSEVRRFILVLSGWLLLSAGYMGFASAKEEAA